MFTLKDPMKKTDLILLAEKSRIFLLMNHMDLVKMNFCISFQYMNNNSALLWEFTEKGGGENA